MEIFNPIRNTYAISKNNFGLREVAVLGISINKLKTC